MPTAKHVEMADSLQTLDGCCREPMAEQRVVKAGPLLTSCGAVDAQILLRQAPNWPSRRSTADSDCQNLLCAGLRRSASVLYVGHRRQRQCDNTVTGPLTATRSLPSLAHYSASPHLSGLSSSHHQNGSPCAGDYLWARCTLGVFLLGAAAFRPQGMLRVCALYLSTYRYR